MSENVNPLQALLEKFYEILLSGTKHVNTLEFAIEACHKALKEEIKDTELEKYLKDIKRETADQRKAGKTTKCKIGYCKIVKLF